MKKKVLIFSGGRQDYYLLKPLVSELLKINTLEAGFLLGETHFSKLYGKTINQIKKDKIPVWGKIYSKIDGDSPLNIINKMANTSIKVSKILLKIKPTVIVLLGDRYELLATAQAAMLHNIPIAHLHGGESTEGLIDEAIRHSISKMSHIHFVSTKKYYTRLVQMGENPRYVFNHGALGIDNIKNLEVLSKKKLFNSLDLNINYKTFLITYHPLTLDQETSNLQLNNLLKVLLNFKKTNLVFTYPNSDTYGLAIIKTIKKFIKNQNIKSIFVENLGSTRYLNLIKYSNLIIGNSSSGIIEAPSLGIPTINIGKRQNGRVQAASVIQAKGTKKSILDSIKLGLEKEFIKKAKLKKNPYGKGKSALKIAYTLNKIDYKNIIFKKFYDINFYK